MMATYGARKRPPANLELVVVIAMAVLTAAAPAQAAPTVAPVHARSAAVVGGPIGSSPELVPVGRLLSEDRSCTAAVIGSRSGRLALTAAHCVYIPPVTDLMPGLAAGRPAGWIDDQLFVPAWANEEASQDAYAVERMWVDRTWQAEAIPELDVAVLELRDSAGGTAQAVLGALGVRFSDAVDRPSSSPVDVLGYPVAAPFGGTHLMRCEGVSTDARSAGILQARCGLTAGASGGPWLVREDGWWTTVGVTSYRSIAEPDVLGGTRLGTAAERLWRAADQAAM